MLNLLKNKELKSKKILIVLRLYDGLTKSIINGIWEPTGVPAMSNLIKKINLSKLEIILYFYIPIEKQGSFEINKKFNKVLNRNINLMLPFPNSKKLRSFQKLFVIINYLKYGFQTFQLMKKFNCSLLYTDRSNVIGAALVSFFLNKKKVILRLLGIQKTFVNYINSNSLIPFIFRLAYKSKFDTIIGTNDGSSIKNFLREFTQKSIDKYVETNGVNKVKFSKLKTNDQYRIIFLGRLEKNKGIYYFLETLKLLRENNVKNIKVEIIGDGNERRKVSLFCKKHDLEKFVVIHGSIEHSKVLTNLSNSDIYISLNNDGQISNSNLEATRAGLCLIFGKTISENDKNAIDFGYNNNNVFWIDKNINDHLFKIISNLISNPTKIIQRKKNTRKLSSKIKTISERIDWEINIIKNHLIDYEK